MEHQMAGLRMSAEIGDWLADLCSAEPDTAIEAGAALIAVIDSRPGVSAPMITDLSVPPVADPEDLGIAVDAAYQDLLAWLQMLRRHADETGSQWQTTTRQRITRQGSEPNPWTQDEIAAMREREAELTARCQRGQREADAFRVRKEAAKARHTAASARRRVQLAAIAALHTAAERRELTEAQAELARAEQELNTATTDLVALLAQAGDLQRKLLGDVAGEDVPQASTAAEGLLELRVDPRGADVRILCAFEPADTLTLFAVLEGEAAISENRTLAIGLAGELLNEIRADGWPAEMGDGAAIDTATFLATFFPDRIGAVTGRAAELAAADTLAGLRRRHGLSLAEVARMSGLTEHETWKLESESLDSARLHARPLF
jgi:hypothetical protein